MGKITIAEFKTKVLSRVFFEYSQQKGLDDVRFWKSILFHANIFLKENHFDECVIKKRGKRFFMIYEPNERIVCELGIFDRQIELITMKGICTDSSTLDYIVERTAKLGMRKGK